MKRFFIYLAFLLLRLIAYLPHRIRLAIGRLIGLLVYYCSAKSRKVTSINIKLCYPNLPQLEQNTLVKNSFMSLGMGIIEAAMGWYLPKHRLRNLFVIKGRKNVELALQQKRGVIMLGLHLTTAELVGRFIADLVPLSVMYQRPKDPLLHAKLLICRQSIYQDVIPNTRIKRLITHLRNNELIWYAPDQAPNHKKRVFAPLFGITTATATTTSELARLTNAPILPVAYYRKPDYSGYEIIAFPMLEKFPSDYGIDDATRLNAIVEKLINEHPEQYLWQYKRFKFGPQGPTQYYD